MSWNALGAQFCLELSFGVLFALAFVPKAPVGVLFYRIMGTTAFVPLFLAGLVPLLSGRNRWNDPAIVASVLALVAYPIVTGPFRGRKWAFALAWSLACNIVALVATIAHARTIESRGALALGSLSAMATGCVAGSVGLAMVLGHWYLTIPTLHVRHLQRLNRLTVISMLCCLTIVSITCAVFSDALNSAETPLLGAFGLFYLGTRLTAGLLLPMLFAWMAAGSLKYQNTRSATGILYASTILVLIGTAVSISLQDSYGIPL